MYYTGEITSLLYFTIFWFILFIFGYLCHPHFPFVLLLFFKTDGGRKGAVGI